MFLEEKREKVLRTLSSFGHPLKQPLKSSVKKVQCQVYFLSKAYVCGERKERRQTVYGFMKGGVEGRKTKVLDSVSQ